jgi:hypothetical protein
MKETYSRDDKTTVCIAYADGLLDGENVKCIIANMFSGAFSDLDIFVGATVLHPQDSFDRKKGNWVAKQNLRKIVFHPDLSSLVWSYTFDIGLRNTRIALIRFKSQEGDELQLEWTFTTNNEGNINWKSFPRIKEFSSPNFGLRGVKLEIW